MSILSLEGLNIDEILDYEEVPVEILDQLVKRLRSNEIASVKVLLRNQLVEVCTTEYEAYMKSKYPHIFTYPPIKT